MIDKDTIIIRNVYYMLAYAYQALRQTNFKHLASEDFAHIDDLYAAIIIIGMRQLLKQGLRRRYKLRSENLTVLRGKMLISPTIKNHIHQQPQLAYCEYDELSENNIYNSVLKSTMNLLLGQANLQLENRTALRNILYRMDGIDSVSFSAIPWTALNRHSRNPLYNMLINICYYVYRHLLISQTAGNREILDFRDDMEAVFEKFVLEYYRHQGLTANPDEFQWYHDNDTFNNLGGLPIMRTDITIKKGDRTLIIDTKYYGKITASRYEREKYRSGHLYQIFAYVKNYDLVHADGGYQNIKQWFGCSVYPNKATGVLLYAKTSSETIPRLDFYHEGNRLAVRTLDLDQDFTGITANLDELIKNYL